LIEHIQTHFYINIRNYYRAIYEMFNIADIQILQPIIQLFRK
jgi:hypothetical protein